MRSDDVPAFPTAAASRKRPMAFAAAVYGFATLAMLIAWGLWKDAQAEAQCGAGCGRAMALTFALGIIIVPAAAAFGTLAEIVASRVPRWIAHGMGIAVALTVFALIRHPLAGVLA